MNTEQKHTPGPWHVDYAQGIIAADGTVVAYVEADHSDTPTPDGNLIAAAPDLLEAARLQERHEWARRNLESIGADRLHPSRLSLVMEVERTAHEASMARKAAIAKAEGKA